MGQISHQLFLVGTKAIIANRNGVLALKASGEQTWELPGGRINEGEDIQSALTRELGEELPGIPLHLIEDLVHAGPGDFIAPGQRLMLIYFRVTLGLSDLPTQLSQEHEACRWIRRDQISRVRMWSPDKQALRKYFARIC